MTAGGGRLNPATIVSLPPEPLLKEAPLQNRLVFRHADVLDHDVADGAPAARFVARFKGIAEKGEMPD